MNEQSLATASSTLIKGHFIIDASNILYLSSIILL